MGSHVLIFGKTLTLPQLDTANSTDYFACVFFSLYFCRIIVSFCQTCESPSCLLQNYDPNMIYLLLFDFFFSLFHSYRTLFHAYCRPFTDDFTIRFQLLSVKAFEMSWANAISYLLISHASFHVPKKNV